MSAGVSERGAAGACCTGVATEGACDAHPSRTDATTAAVTRIEQVV
jgi:hypothetical protein